MEVSMFLVARHINLFSKSILIPGGDKKRALLQSETAAEESLCILPRLFFIAAVILKKKVSFGIAFLFCITVQCSVSVAEPGSTVTSH